MLRLQQEIEENRRAASNIIRLGVIETASATTVDVQTGANHAKRIPFFVYYAGGVSRYRRPSVGEQCVLLNLGSGDNLNNAVALTGLPSDQFPSPTTDANQVMTDYGNGMSEVYDLAKGQLKAVYPGGLFVDGDIEASGEVSDHTRSMQEDRDIYNSHHHGDSPTPNESQ
ncbi:phage baseplate assembly protein V [Celerinatantimonas sp. MCCC 1A17872]|uniref:phage baseplate assembly protein V n=1 Tax=Celerinatantimonas sp. MCCC 1A17872 TaxID=3177514 RepID=UPI0038C07B9E